MKKTDPNIWKYLRYVILFTYLGIAHHCATGGKIDISLRFDVADFATDTICNDSGESFLLPKWKDMVSGDEPGSPQLPVKVFRVLIPAGSNNFSAKVTATDSPVKLGLSKKIWPVQEPVSLNSNCTLKFTPCNKEKYRSAVHPAPKVTVLGDSFVDGDIHILTLMANPATYAGLDNSLMLYPGLQIEISYDECPVRELRHSVMTPPSRSPYLDIESLVENPQDYDSSVSRILSVSTPSYYCIVTSKRFVNDFEDLKIWKAQKGYKVEIFGFEDIVNEYYKKNPSEDRWSPKALRIFLKEKFENYGAFFCLLAGDYQSGFPVFKLLEEESKQKITDPEHDFNSERFIPSDCYFSDLTTEYTLYRFPTGDYYGKLTDYTYSPDIICGRLLCHSSQDIRNYISKLFIYESDPGKGDPSYLDNFFVFNQFVSARKNHADLIIEQWGDTFRSKTKLIDHKYPDPTLANSTFPTGAEVIGEISKAGFSSWGGHGNPGSVGTSGLSEDERGRYHSPWVYWEGILALNRYTYAQTEIRGERDNGLDKLTNRYKPSVAYSGACTIAPFDNVAKTDSSYYDLPYNVSASFTCGENYGGVAIISNTRSGWSYRYTTGLNLTSRQEAFFIDHLKTYNRIGIAQNKSLAQYNSTFGGNSVIDKYVSATSHLIGEPEFHIWLQEPKIPLRLTRSDNSIALRIFDNSGTGEGVISVYDGNGNSSRYPFRVTSTAEPVINLPFPTNIGKTGECLVSAWKTGCLPVLDYYGQNASIVNRRKSFIVSNAFLGQSVNGSQTKGVFSIGNNSLFYIRALKSITIKEGFMVKKGGKAVLKSDVDMTIDTEIKTEQGSSLTLEAPGITLKSGAVLTQGTVLSRQD